jgi:hypothetical protein
MVAPGQAESGFRRRRWYHRRDLRFLSVVAAVLIAYFGYGYVTGPGRITDRLESALDRDPPTVNIQVTSKFPPESFHMGVYQKYGAMRGSKGNTTTLFRVKPSDVRTLSRKYWIERVDLAE